ncbi:MAG: hypothetical protein PHF13_00475 [Acholeplasmataceae bacterium]|nr:hypothetical protein [Acholeplasmataceae bacterium]
MKKENLWLLINTGIMLVIGIVLVIVANTVIPKEPKDRLFNQVIQLENQETVEGVPAGSSYATIDYKADAVSRSGDVLGTVYNVKVRNGYKLSADDTSGYIELLIAIDENDLVFVEIVVLNQSNWTVKGIQNYIVEYYDGVLLEQIEKFPAYDAADLEAGATAVDSTGTIKNLIIRTLKVHFNIQDDPYIDYFGEGYTLEDDATFIPTEHVIYKQNVKDSSGNDAGTIYELEGTGEYLGYDGISSGSITMYVLFDENAEIISILMPDSLYGHTAGFKARNDAYLNEFIGLTILEIQAVIDENVDLKTGATGSRALIDILLAALSEVN